MTITPKQRLWVTIIFGSRQYTRYIILTATWMTGTRKAFFSKNCAHSLVFQKLIGHLISIVDWICIFGTGFEAVQQDKILIHRRSSRQKTHATTRVRLLQLKTMGFLQDRNPQTNTTSLRTGSNRGQYHTEDMTAYNLTKAVPSNKPSLCTNEIRLIENAIYVHYAPCNYKYIILVYKMFCNGTRHPFIKSNPPSY